MTQPARHWTGRPPVPAPGDGQESLTGDGFDLAGLYGAAAGQLGPVARATMAALAAAGARLTPAHAAMAALAVENARGVDLAAARRDPRAIATASRELRETLSRLRLDPSAAPHGGDTPDDAFTAFLAGLAAPSDGTAEVRDGPHPG